MQKQFGLIAIATGCWLLLAVSIGWYYTVTYFGRVGWPMPSVETVGALVLYYFSVLNVPTEIQAVHWLVVFPLAGFLWAALLPLLARNGSPATPRTKIAAMLALCSLPLSLPLPYMMYVAGLTPSGWELQRMLDVALRRGNISVWPCLSPMYFTLGVITFGLHLWCLRRLFPQALLQSAKHFLMTSVAFVVAVSLVGALASYPLRAWLE